MELFLAQNNETNKPGYPRQANLNISYPDMSDLDDLDSEEMDIFKKLLNENVQEDIEKNTKKNGGGDAEKKRFGTSLFYLWELG